jgi:hypothetical protein
VVRWRNGILEFRNVDVNRLSVKKGKLTFVDLLQHELDSEMQGIGWAEAIVQEDKLVGLAAAKDDQTITAVPCSFINGCLADRKNGALTRASVTSLRVADRGESRHACVFGQEGEPRAS